MKWYEKPVRMMRLDYLKRMDCLKTLDLNALAKEAKERWHINCEWIIGTPGAAPGTGNYVTFKSDKYLKYEALGDFDSIREYLPHARKYGIKVLAYTNMHWFSYAFADEHPGWEQLLSSGTPYGRKSPLYGNGTTLCVNTAWREWEMGLLDELMGTGIDGVFLDGPVIYPGCCYCEVCRNLFAERYKAEMPIEENWRSDTWRHLVEFREQSLASFLADAKTTIEKVNPEGVVFLNAGSLGSSGWRVARDNSVCAPHQHFNGAECFYHPGHPGFPTHAWSMLAKYLTAEALPAVVFSHHALGSWHYVPLPEKESEVSIAQTAANGANPWIAVFSHALEADKERCFAPVEKMNGFLERHEEHYTATRSAAKVAVLLSRQTCNYYVSDWPKIYGVVGTGKEEGLSIDLGGGTQIKPDEWQKRKAACEEILESELRGYCYALFRNHIPFDMILDKDLHPEFLSRYETLILPATACLSASQKEAISEYVEAGGKCIGSFELGCFDEHGNPKDTTLLDFFGVKEIEDAWDLQAFEEYLKVKTEDFGDYSFLREGALLPRPNYCLKVRASDPSAKSPVIFMNRIGALYTNLAGESDYPAVIMARKGKGKTVYFPHALGAAFWKFKIADHENLFMASLIELLGHERQLETDAPPTVEVELRSQPDQNRLLLHVVNMTGDMQRPINYLVTLKDLHFTVAARNVERIHVLDKGAIPFTQTENAVSFTLSELETYDVVVIESGG